MKRFAVFFVLFSLSLQGEILETERAFLYPVSKKHVRILHARLFSDPAVMKSFGTGETYPFQKSVRRVEAHAKRWKEEYPFSGFVAVSKQTHKLVGFVACGNSQRANCAEIIYLVPSNQWRKGWGTELVQAIVQEYLPSLYRKGAPIRSGKTFELHPLLGIEATARTDNPASIKILENLQFEFEGIVERHGTDRALYFFSFENVEQ